MTIKEKIAHVTEEKIASSDNFLVEVKIIPGKIIVTIDHPKGVKIEDCVSLSRYIQEKLETENVFENHELEVGSPGMEEPLKILPQYKKRIGQEISVVTFDGRKHIGTLLSADENALELNEETVVSNGKKKEKQKKLNIIPFNEIKETRVIFSFDKII